MGNELGKFFGVHAAEAAKTEPTMQCYFKLLASTMEVFQPRKMRKTLKVASTTKREKCSDCSFQSRHDEAVFTTNLTDRTNEGASTMKQSLPRKMRKLLGRWSEATIC